MESGTYRRHQPEKTLLYQVVQEHLETFLAYADSRGGGPLPQYVRDTFRRFLKCGMLQNGFARVRCPGCGFDSLVAFSCKERSVCPSCAARRMSDTAAYLVDEVLPEVPVRQWVLSVPRPIRYLFARNAKLLSEGLRIFAAEVFRHLRKRSGVRPMRGALPGAVTAVQRFGGALNLNIHFHMLALDGVYVRSGEGRLEFRRVAAPTRSELKEVLARSARRIVWMLKRRGFAVGLDGEVLGDSEEPPELYDWIRGASVREWLTMEGQARRVPVLGRPEEWAAPPAPKESRWAVRGRGFSLHAGVRIARQDREGLEKLCRYALRPPFSGERMERLPDGRIAYGFRKARPDGSTHVVLTPLELLEKVAALVPPPRAHLVVYHGVLAPRSRARSEVVRGPAAEPCRGHRRSEEVVLDEPPRRRGRRRMDWAKLLKRTTGLDVLACERCGGRMEVIACIEEPDTVKRILESMGLPTELPRPAPARSPEGQQGLDFEIDQERAG